MALHKLLVDDFNDDIYALIAIHCRVEDYRMAYLINKQLGVNLVRRTKDLDLNYTSSNYALFDWYDEPNDEDWYLVANVCKKEEESLSSTGMLFSDDLKVTKTYNLVPEMSQVDYFLKISNDRCQVNTKLIGDKLQQIPQVITNYNVELSKVKSKEHLIF